jgi:hypothetical protein
LGTSLIKPTSNLTSNLAPLSKPLKRSKRQDDDDDDDGNEDENCENKSKLNTSNKLSSTAASWSKLRENCKKQKITRMTIMTRQNLCHNIESH